MDNKELKPKRPEMKQPEEVAKGVKEGSKKVIGKKLKEVDTTGGF